MWPTYGDPIHDMSAVLTELAPSVVAAIPTRAANSILCEHIKNTGANTAATLSDESEKSLIR